jgi:two-component system, OmpR family, response regulator
MRILVVEDDPDLARQLQAALTSANYAVDLAHDGEEARFLGESEPYDAVVLDLGLPVLGGVEVLKIWRQGDRDMPVLVLTVRDRWHEKVAAFDAGADDYVVKPFHLEEVQARLRALIRRRNGHASSILTCGPLAIDLGRAQAMLHGEPVPLTALEYRLLAYLAHHGGRVVSRTELTEHLYSQDFDRDSNTIEVFVGRIRRKVGAGFVKTVRGLGYQLNCEGSAD